MTYTITICENTRAQLIISETRTTDANVAHMTKEYGEKCGHKVFVKVEG